jgi:hypothetical protein
MATLQRGIKILWGDAPCPPLPFGYSLLRRSNAPAIAEDVAGRRYLIVLDPQSLVPEVPEPGAKWPQWDFAQAKPF